MATHYLIPDSITYRAVKATGGAMSRPHFTVLLLYFNRPSTDFNNDDAIYPSYDGQHEGLLQTNQYSLLGTRGVSPIGVNNDTNPWDPSQSPLIVGDIEGEYVQVVHTHDTYVDNLSVYFNNTFYGNVSFSDSFYWFVGIALAVFSDGKVCFGWIQDTYNTAHPNMDYTYLAATDERFGYLISSVGGNGYASIKMPSGFRLLDIAFNIGRILKQETYIQSTDPYDNFPEPSDKGGDGDPAGPGDDVDIPATPSISAGSSGLVTLYNPTLPQLQYLANYLWSGAFDLSSFKKIFANPMDCILGLSIVPVEIPNGHIQSISVGNVSTGINVSTAGADYVEVNCGTLEVPRVFNSYLDYSPFTTVDIYLPYIGVRHLDTDNIIPGAGESTRSVKVVYKVDLFSGACIAFIKCGGSVMYSYAGQCATQIPVTGNSWTELYKAIAGVATSAIGGFSASSTFASNRQTTQIGKGGGDVFHRHSSMSSSNSASRSGGADAASIADVVFAAKPRVDRTGTLSSAVGLLGVQRPYLIIRRPVPCIPRRQNEFTGYPSNMFKQLSELSGYVEMEEIHLEHLPATENEVEEIYSLLKSGVII